MSSSPKICKKHGELQEKDIRMFSHKGYKHIQCRPCNREWDKVKRQKKEYKEKALARSSTPESKEKAKIRAIAYRERRRVVASALYQRKKNNPDFKDKNNKYSKKKYQQMKDAFDDNYVKKVLKVYAHATPEMIESKKQQILEFRKIRNEMKKNKELLFKQKEEIKLYREINGIVKVCKYHGDLKKEDCYFVLNGTESTQRIYKCKSCEKIRRMEYYENNFSNINERQKLYAQKNKEAIRNRTKDWYQRLSDAYVRRFFMKNTQIKAEHITPELLELKRISLRLKRKIRNQNKLFKLEILKNGKNNINESIA